ncbi:MAG: sodium/solute symporter [Acidobacteria bacterium]|nr:sodium/solute symporter [Acidobacteriota bacterium]
MSWIDFAVLAAYLAGIVAFGSWFSKSHRDVRDYFVSGGAVPWWAIMGSIVATETSTVTFISVPGYAYTTNFTFLQLVMGYMIGRLAVSLLFIPAYFRGEIITVYQLLGTRFGTPVKRLASSVFLATRTLADGFRLFATGLVLAALLGATPALSGYSTHAILVASVLIMGIATIIYTYHGGMTAVIWTDVIQLVVYLVGAFLAAYILILRIPGGWAEITATATSGGRLRVFDFTFDLTRGYTFWSGVVGGAFLTTATHGTDQLMVQRYFCAKSAGDARKALLWSGVAVFAQFALFLLIGAMLYVYYSGYAPQEAAAFMREGRIQSDRIFPTFIVHHLPTGAVGLVLAAIFAAAMSTLSSSLNSSSAAALADFYIPATGGRRSDAHYLRVSRIATLVWGVLQIVVAIAAISLSSRVVDEVLGIASFTNGIILGVFLLGTLTRRVGQTAAFAGILVGAGVMLWLKLFTAVSWQWYVLVGATTTFAVGVLASLTVPSAAPSGAPEP